MKTNKKQNILAAALACAVASLALTSASARLRSSEKSCGFSVMECLQHACSFVR